MIDKQTGKQHELFLKLLQYITTKTKQSNRGPHQEIMLYGLLALNSGYIIILLIVIITTEPAYE